MTPQATHIFICKYWKRYVFLPIAKQSHLSINHKVINNLQHSIQMKKTFIALAATLILGGAASAQYYSNGKFSGTKTYSIGIGSAIPVSPYLADEEYAVYTSQTAHVPSLSAVLRAEREFTINEDFSWGYQYELNWIKYGADYTSVNYSSLQREGTYSRWDLRFDVRLTLGLYITDNLEVYLGIGGGESFLHHIKNHYTETDGSGNVSESDDGSAINFGGSAVGNAMLGINYHFSDNLLTFFNLRGDMLSGKYFSTLSGGSYSYRLVPMVGIGFSL